MLVILSNMVTNFAALHSGLLAVGHQTQTPAPICGARIIKDHKLKLYGRQNPRTMLLCVMIINYVDLKLDKAASQLSSQRKKKRAP